MPTSAQTKILFLLLCVTLSSAAIAQKKVREPWSVPERNNLHVVDDASLLQPETIAALETKLKNYQDSTGRLVAVLTVFDLWSIVEIYTPKVLYEWERGKKHKIDVLMVIVEKKREVRIEVDSAMLSKLRPSVCAQIIDEKIVPSFKEKNYDQGVTKAVSAILRGIDGTYPPKESASTGPPMFAWIAIGVLAAIGFVGVFSKYHTVPFFAALLPFFLVGSALFLSWWVVGAYAVLYPTLRFIVVKTKMKQLKFWKDTGSSSVPDH